MAGKITIDTEKRLGEPSDDVSEITVACSSKIHYGVTCYYDADDDCDMCLLMTRFVQPEMVALKAQVEQLNKDLRLAHYDLDAERTAHDALKIEAAPYLRMKQVVSDKVEEKLE